jgi:hypothetical protein
MAYAVLALVLTGAMKATKPAESVPTGSSTTSAVSRVFTFAPRDAHLVDDVAEDRPGACQRPTSLKTHG